MRFFKQVFREFSADNIFKYSASLAYYTVFSFGPLLVIVISLSGTLFGKEAVQGEIYDQLNKVLGRVTALQVQDTIKNIHLSGNGLIATTVSIILLVVAATTIFGEMQDSLNKIWGLKIRKGRVWWKIVLTRLLSFSLIISIGIIVVLSLALNALLTAFGNYISRYIDSIELYYMDIVNNGISFLAAAFLFVLIFKILPDAVIRWRDVIVGGIVTSVLFSIGKWGVGFYLIHSNLASLYGAAGSIVIFMVWVYYSAVILYFGAEFTKVFAKLYGGQIKPNEYSEWIKIDGDAVDNPK